MTRPAPLTTAAHGSTRCVGCSKRFTDTPGLPVTDTVANVSDGWGTSPSGKAYRRLGYHDVTRRWHEKCLADFEAQNEENRRRAAADHDQMVRDLCEAAGLDYETVKAEHDRRQQEAQEENA